MVEGLNELVAIEARVLKALANEPETFIDGVFRIVRSAGGHEIELFSKDRPLVHVLSAVLASNPTLSPPIDRIDKAYRGLIAAKGEAATDLMRQELSAAVGQWRAVKGPESEIASRLTTLEKQIKTLTGDPLRAAEDEASVLRLLTDFVDMREVSGLMTVSPKQLRDIMSGLSTREIDKAALSKKWSTAFWRAIVSDRKQAPDAVALMLDQVPRGDPMWEEILRTLRPAIERDPSILSRPAEPGLTRAARKAAKQAAAGVVSGLQGIIAESLVVRQPGFVLGLMLPMVNEAARVARELGWSYRISFQPVYVASLVDRGFKESYDVSIWIVKEATKETAATAMPFFSLQVKAGDTRELLAQLVSDDKRMWAGLVTFGDDIYVLKAPAGFEVQRAIAAPELPSWNKLDSETFVVHEPIMVEVGMSREEIQEAAQWLAEKGASTIQ